MESYTRKSMEKTGLKIAAAILGIALIITGLNDWQYIKEIKKRDGKLSNKIDQSTELMPAEGPINSSNPQNEETLPLAKKKNGEGGSKPEIAEHKINEVEIKKGEPEEITNQGDLKRIPVRGGTKMLVKRIEQGERGLTVYDVNGIPLKMKWFEVGVEIRGKLFKDLEKELNRNARQFERKLNPPIEVKNGP